MHSRDQHDPVAPAAPPQAQTNALSGIAFGADITAAAQRHHLDPVLLGAVAAQETGGPGANQGRNIVGDHGHGRGVFQIDDRWHDFASTPAAMDPARNADYAAGMLRGLIDRNGGDVRAALHDYNAGSASRASTTTPWPDGKTLSYEDSVLRHEANLRAHLGLPAQNQSPTPGAATHVTPAHAAPTHAAPPHASAAGAARAAATDDTRPDADRILGETRDGKIVETKAELTEKNALLARAEHDARAGRIDDAHFVGDGRESAREVARQNEKLWRGVEANVPANGAPPLPAPRRDGYRQEGTVVRVADGIVEQHVGRGRTATYAEADFANPPVAGTSYTIAYHHGAATATPTRDPQVLQR